MPRHDGYLRLDGSRKGPGFLGTLRRPDGKDSTELSIGIEMDGREVEVPSLVPTLSQGEISHLLEGKKPTGEIIRKAYEHAIERLGAGLSVFKEQEEEDYFQVGFLLFKGQDIACVGPEGWGKGEGVYVSCFSINQQ